MTSTLPAAAAEPFVIEVVDADTERGVPLVELRTVAGQRFITDSAGLVAVDDAALEGQQVYFTISSHGYEFPADGFGFHGKRLAVTAGDSDRIAVKRLNVAERLYRITGAGIYEHAVKAGREAPLAHPLLNAGVAGSDSTQCVVYQGELFWLWGDTNRLGYPLGNFHTTCATSLFPAAGGLSPDKGIELRYFGDGKGFVSEMAKLPGEGPTWLTGLANLPDGEGAEHLVATYMKVKPPLDVYERGLCEFDPGKGAFQKLLAFPRDAELLPTGHAFRHTVDGRKWMYFGEATPHMRVAEHYESWRDASSYERVRPDVQFANAVEGIRVSPHNGHVAWQPYRRKWVSIFCEQGGKSSYLGEIWYAEADAPEGPWRKAVKIITHDDYSFYNPTQHPHFAAAGSKYLYLEGTYVTTFSGNKSPTPLYDYNQIMYRLDLDDPRLEPSRR